MHCVGSAEPPPVQYPLPQGKRYDSDGGTGQDTDTGSGHGVTAGSQVTLRLSEPVYVPSSAAPHPPFPVPVPSVAASRLETLAKHDRDGPTTHRPDCAHSIDGVL